jgi:hypothetical protein
MSNIFQDEITLPGVITHVEADYSYGFDSSLFGTTDPEIIIGTAFNGPTGVLTPVYSVEHAIYTFGDAYDSKKRQEASLIPEVKNAWDRGCRTIYCMRIGGKEMYKDFNLKIDSKYKLRIKSMFPSDGGKECYVLFDGSAGAEVLSFYKPINRATVAEKMRGVASGNKTVIKNSISLYDQGLTRDDRLIDLISKFNAHRFNNVLLMSIVDENGNDVTGSPETYELSIGALYKGAYFIGRSNTVAAVPAITKTRFVYVSNEDQKPYSKFDGKYYRELVKNTDVSAAYPIFGSKKELTADFQKGSVLMATEWDFLEIAEASDKLFAPDKVDYEEVALSAFEIYRRLGCGFAVTAHAIRRVKKDKDGNEIELAPRIKESAADDANHIAPIEDGIYSILQGSNAKYRVLTCVNADDSINGKLPRAIDFRIAVANDAEILNGDVIATAAVDQKDLKAARNYTVSFEHLPEDLEAIDMEKVDVSVIRKIVVERNMDLSASDYAAGEMVVNSKGQLERVNGDSFEVLEPAAVADMKLLVFALDGSVSVKDVDASGALVDVVPSKEYLLADVMDSVFVFEAATGRNLGDLKALGSDEIDKLTVAATNLPGVANKVVVRSNMFDTMTVEELVNDLNEHAVFSRLFHLELSEQGSLEKDDFVSEAQFASQAFGQEAKVAVLDEKGNEIQAAIAEVPAEEIAIVDRILTYDYSKYIPFRTNDNFLRQLAQHCTQTELKTGPTHGVMGVKVMTNTGISAVAKKVSDILERDFDLYAKNIYGHNMLDANSLPYPIGKNVSLVFGQYAVTVGQNNYRYISNGAAGYAGFVTTLPLDQSSTGQPISLPELSYQLTNSQLGQLTKAGIVTFHDSFTRGTVVTDGITMAPADSIFRRLSTSRIVGACEELIRAAAEPFIGKENHQANRNALNTAIKGELDKIVGVLIENYDFKMNSDPTLAKFSYIEIFYQIIPIYEIREVRNSIKMVDSITTTTVGA